MAEHHPQVAAAHVLDGNGHLEKAAEKSGNQRGGGASGRDPAAESGETASVMKRRRRRAGVSLPSPFHSNKAASPGSK